eukprot:6770334-Pyramimonas_sp.AAC.1
MVYTWVRIKCPEWLWEARVRLQARLGQIEPTFASMESALRTPRVDPGEDLRRPLDRYRRGSSRGLWGCR